VIRRDHPESKAMGWLPIRDDLCHGATIGDAAPFGSYSARRFRKFTCDGTGDSKAEVTRCCHLRVRKQRPESITTRSNYF
jgi:hypothetical protein